MEHLEFCERLTASWVRRAGTQGIRPNTMVYKKSQFDFFIGACTAMEILNTTPKAPLLAVSVSVALGRESRDVWPGYTKYMKVDEEPAQKDPEPLDPKSG